MSAAKGMKSHPAFSQAALFFWHFCRAASSSRAPSLPAIALGRMGVSTVKSMATGRRPNPHTRMSAGRSLAGDQAGLGSTAPSGLCSPLRRGYGPSVVRTPERRTQNLAQLRNSRGGVFSSANGEDSVQVVACAIER